MTAESDELLRSIYPEVERLVHRRLAGDFRAKRPWLATMFSTGDIVQEVFHGVVRDLPRRDWDRDELAPILAKRIEHRIIDRIRFHEAARRDARADRELESPAHDATPSRLAALDERAALLERALDSLTDRERCLWRRRAIDDEAFADIAEALDYSNAEAARSAFRRTQAALAITLRRLGIDLDSG